jgi:hypothetical protein
VAGFVETKNGPAEVPFDPKRKEMYLAFLVKRI